ncbi:MAG: T9SS type A sorting domain-containing protein [Chitinophagaceae bacterium]|nr:T9SS type A sorting domain-containing protein [Chitinophagaceae bacterium]
MKRLILLCFVSMLTPVCYAQYAGLFHPAISNLAKEPKNIVTDFIYSLKGNTKIHLQWKVASVDMVDFFSIERSANGRDFEMIEVVKLLSNNKFEFIDESPLPGKSFYRIRTSLRGKALYSHPLTVYMGNDLSFKFYPNPADNILIVRSDIPIDVQIADASGEVRINQYRVLGLQTINVSTLEKGIYMIRFTNKVSNTVSIEKLFKN